MEPNAPVPTVAQPEPVTPQPQPVAPQPPAPTSYQPTSSTTTTKRSKITARGIQIALGLFWLLDGALQLQHQMFTSNFANNVLAPAADGQPGIVSGPMNLSIHLILRHPAFFDALFALVQLAIGALILWKRTTKVGLWGSVIWGLAVWY